MLDHLLSSVYPEFMCEKDHKTRAKDINFITYYLLFVALSTAPTECKITYLISK